MRFLHQFGLLKPLRHQKNLSINLFRRIDEIGRKLVVRLLHSLNLAIVRAYLKVHLAKIGCAHRFEIVHLLTEACV